MVVNEVGGQRVADFGETGPAVHASAQLGYVGQELLCCNGSAAIHPIGDHPMACRRHDRRLRCERTVLRPQVQRRCRRQQKAASSSTTILGGVREPDAQRRVGDLVTAARACAGTVTTARTEVDEQTVVTGAGERPPLPPPQLPPAARLLEALRAEPRTPRNHRQAGGDRTADRHGAHRRRAHPTRCGHTVCLGVGESGEPLVHSRGVATGRVEADSAQHVCPHHTGAVSQCLQIGVQTLAGDRSEPNRQRPHGHDGNRARRLR